jgi:HdeA/HdeB family protein
MTKKQTAIALVLPLCAVALSLSACATAHSAKTANPPKMTCEEFLALGSDVQPRAVAWLDGYSKGKLREQDIGEIDVDRQIDVLVVACKQDPKVTLWDKMRAHFPGGSKKVKPTKMTCQEFVDLDQTTRPEVVYWADGYNTASKVQEGVVDEVDLQRNVGVIYEECKQAPKESLWTKLKKHF